MSTITTQNPNTTTPTSQPQTTTNGGGGAAARQACAACKHQRRRCSEQCLLAPYFPADKQRDFHNVHKLFGVNNVVKLLKKVAQHDREDAMKSVIYEANMRAINPVGGCYAVINHLQKQINLCVSELDGVIKHLEFYKAKFNVYDQLQQQESVGIEMIERFAKNQENGESSSQVKIEMVQQFLNDRESLMNQDGMNEVLKDEDDS